ncbi:hypothetical protein L3Q65_00865 (plasmid) [Amycolatopsis sp. FU40]|uniref:hypothetical protein n=1 Tax=Amycolatopsis sp. FU40 TaxID=2914159 RepID=UPI001F3D3160|nr:hypothetical protein [Amycolatopsis sp. FU40]UKD50877.1 hypothetical protein L3Q65_00865 [Amycolatopsis sp. FU40]
MSCLHFEADEIRYAQTMADMSEIYRGPEKGFSSVMWVQPDPGAYLVWNAWNHATSTSTSDDHYIDQIDERFLEFLTTDPDGELGERVLILRRDTGNAWKPGDWDDAVAAMAPR